MSMSFSDRIKKEMAEGIVRAILEDAQYRVIDSGIERVLREVSCLSAVEYRALGYPDAMSHLPDFTVMNREQTTKQLVEVKYRSNWSKALFDEVREQVRLFGEIVLVSINARATDPKGYNSPSRFIRCCGLKYDGGVYLVQHNSKEGVVQWTPFHEVMDGSHLWWSMLKLHEKFPQLGEESNRSTLFQAVNALAGILDP
jgi:hypothetical protein